MSDYVTVSLCVNDGQTGMPTGRVCGVDFGDYEVSLASGFWCDADNPTCSIDPAKHRMRVGRFVYPIHGHSSHVGNWCWDAVSMKRDDARRLIANLLGRGFTIDEQSEETDLIPEDQTCDFTANDEGVVQ